MGKRTQDVEEELVPNAFFAIGAQKEAIMQRFGESDNGRLRAFAAFLDAHLCLETDFITKFFKRSASGSHISKTLCEVARRQQVDPPLIKENINEPAAFTVHAALHNAANKVLQDHSPAESLTATVVKFVGKGHGTLNCASNALRTAEWRSLASELLLAEDAGLDSRSRRARAAAVPTIDELLCNVFQDRFNRFEDAIAAAMKILAHIRAQVFLEASLQDARQKVGKGPQLKTEAMTDDVVECVHLKFSELENAARRLIDYIAAHADYKAIVVEHGLQHTLSSVVAGGKLRTMRILCFNKGGKDEVANYGGLKKYARFNLSTGWSELTHELVRLQVLQEFKSENGPLRLYMRTAMNLPGTTKELLQGWSLSADAQRWLFA